MRILTLRNITFAMLIVCGGLGIAQLTLDQPFKATISFTLSLAMLGVLLFKREGH